MSKTCSHEGCDKCVSAMGLCSMHYMRLRRAGLVPTGTRARGTLEERFWRKVEKSDGCWEWQGTISPNGYGRIQEGGKGTAHLGAHRVSYEMHKGPIPEGMVVMHSCDNRRCVNPAHLSVGTHSENTRDAVQKGRWHHKPPCKKGESHSQAKLTEDMIREIRACPKDKVPGHVLAAKYGVRATTINAIRRGKSWKHVV